jgi:hypothetical protein
MRSTNFLVLAGPSLVSFLACTTTEPPADPQPEVAAQVTPETSSTPESPEAELVEIKSRLEAAKARLFDSGNYNCCVQPSCDWCALHEGACDCFANLQAGEAVCPGCGLGWHNGQGIVDGIEARDVKWNITHQHAAGGHPH